MERATINSRKIEQGLTDRVSSQPSFEGWGIIPLERSLLSCKTFLEMLLPALSLEVLTGLLYCLLLIAGFLLASYRLPLFMTPHATTAILRASA